MGIRSTIIERRPRARLGSLAFVLLLLSVDGCGKLLGLQSTEQSQPDDPSLGSLGKAGGPVDLGDAGSPDAAGGTDQSGSGNDGSVPAHSDGPPAGAGGIALGGIAGAGGVEIGGVAGSSQGNPTGAAAGSGAGGGGGEADAPQAGAGGQPSRIPVGALVDFETQCVGIASIDGSVVTNPVAVRRTCDDDAAQRWSRDSKGHLNATALSDAFLGASADVGSQAEGGSNGAAVRVSAGVEPPSADQTWVFQDVQLVMDGGLCLDVPFGDFHDNAVVQLYQCHLGTSQAWTITPAGQIQHDSYCLDLPWANTDEGTNVQVYGCIDPPPDNQRFILDHGRLEPVSSGKCLGVEGDPTVSQTPVEVRLCQSLSGPRPPSQAFRIHGAIRNQGLCLDAGSATSVGSAVGLQVCSGAPQQIWDYYF